VETIEKSKLYPKPLFELPKDEVKLFVGESQAYYVKKWESAKNPYQKSGWNWAAFFGGIFWLGYRKMYSIVLGLIGIFLLIDILQLFIKYDLSKSIASSTAAILGLLGNSFYYRHMHKKISKIKNDNLDKTNLKDAIHKAGGTSWYGVGIVFLILIGYLLVTITINDIANFFTQYIFK